MRDEDKHEISFSVPNAIRLPNPWLHLDVNYLEHKSFPCDAALIHRGIAQRRINRDKREPVKPKH